MSDNIIPRDTNRVPYPMAPVVTDTPASDTTVGSSSAALAAAATSGVRRVVLTNVTDPSGCTVPLDGAVRVRLGAAAAAGSGHVIQVGETHTFVTNLSVNAIRANATKDAVVAITVQEL